MRRLFPVLLLAFLTAVGCSRQPPPHVGEWDAEYFSNHKKLYRLPVPYKTSIVFYFSGKNDVQYLTINHRQGTKALWEGKYTFDYSKNPIQLNIAWTSGSKVSHHGIIRYFGSDKKQMQYCFSLNDEPRPTNFDNTSLCYWLTKKVKE